MENHPIPQDVTGFKFKLIGSVTVKQFLYLLGFGILATICFVLGISPFIKYPLMALFAGIGVGLAFVPIEGRPMDTMISNFAKTIPAENRFIFRKRGVNLAQFEFFKITVAPKLTSAGAPQPTQRKIDDDSHDEKKAMLVSRLRNSGFRPDESETRLLTNIKSYFGDSTTSPSETLPQEAVPHAPTLHTPISADANPLTTPIVPIPEMEPQKKEEVLKVNDESSKSENARLIGPAGTLLAGFPSIPDIGNVVLGIVRDPRNKTLPNILVEVFDNNNTPVRAFKTNALGQFAAATLLNNGTYKISFSDPSHQHEFGTIEITLTGAIFNPLEVTSVDSREKLRRELFGGQAQTATT